MDHGPLVTTALQPNLLVGSNRFRRKRRSLCASTLTCWIGSRPKALGIKRALMLYSVPTKTKLPNHAVNWTPAGEAGCREHLVRHRLPYSLGLRR